MAASDSTWRRPLIAFALSAVAFAACAVEHERFDRDHLSSRVAEATGFSLRPDGSESALPPKVVLEDGVIEEEAIAIALWNNARFGEALTELGLRRADLAAAGMLKNPVFSLLFPLGPKQLEFTLTMPLEALLLRPARIEAAEFECERVSQLLVLGGMDLVRDVRNAFTALWLARRNLDLALETAAAFGRLEELVAIRLAEGEAAPLERDRAAIQSGEALRKVRSARAAIALTTARLLDLLGLAQIGEPPLFMTPAPPDRVPPPDELGEATSIDHAFAVRPDLRGAELAVDAARVRVGIADRDWLKFAAILDANGAGSDGFEAGPGLAVEIPIFDAGGARGMFADAELRAAIARLVSMRRRIALEVTEALLAYGSARDDLLALDEQVIPSATAARTRAELAVRLGDVDPGIAIEASLRLIEAEQQRGLALSRLHDATAQLERDCGPRLTPTRAPR